MTTEDKLWMHIGRSLADEEVYVHAHTPEGDQYISVCVDGTIVLRRDEWELLKLARRGED